MYRRSPRYRHYNAAMDSARYLLAWDGELPGATDTVREEWWVVLHMGMAARPGTCPPVPRGSAWARNWNLQPQPASAAL
jgi:hypothetical protein